MNTLFINDRGVSIELLHRLGSLPAAQLSQARKIGPAPVRNPFVGNNVKIFTHAFLKL